MKYFFPILFSGTFILFISNITVIKPLFKISFIKSAKLDTLPIFVKGGKFKMGDKFGEKDEMPVHKVRLSGFYIGKYEVSNIEFARFLNKKGNKYEDHSYWINMEGKWRGLKCRIYQIDNEFLVENGYENYPVNFVNWYGANAYCKWKGGRLPTEAEWEYAAKGGVPTGSTTWKDSGIHIDEKAWYSSNSDNKIHKIGTKYANTLGIHDMQGNLWEWCSDWYDVKFYTKSGRNNPENINIAEYKVMRGGSWANNETMLRITNRNAVKPNINKINLGFRIVFDL